MKKLRTNYMGYPVEVTLEPLPECDAPDYGIPDSIVDLLCEKIDEGERSGIFSDMPDDQMLSGSGKGHTRSGFWRVIELDYEKISRILSWERSFDRNEALSKELFIRYYGSHMGEHYYEKWIHYNRNLHDMLNHFKLCPLEGQLFCDMIMEQMHKFEERKRGEMGLKSTDNTPEKMQP